MKYYLILLLTLFTTGSFATDCGPLSTTIGTVIKVSTVAEFKNAINQVNKSGGNMTILIEDGTYEVASTSWYPYITASNIVIRSVSGNRDAVILKGGGMRSSSNSEHIFYLNGNNITIADITIGECSGHGVAIDPEKHDFLIHNVRIYNTYQQLIKSNKNTSGIGADNGTVECCLLEYTAGQAPYYYTAGVDVHNGDNWLVRKNTIKNVRRPDGTLTEHAIHFWSDSRDGVIEKNTIVNCDRGIGLGLGTSSVSGFLVKNNMVHTSRDVGIAIESSPNSKIYNNTIYTENYSNSIEYRFAKTSGTKIYNNLTNQKIKLRDGASGDVQDNLTNAQSSWFKSHSKGDLHLVDNNSSVVDKGRTITEVSTDFDGDTRPQWAAYDIGADEYSSATSISNIYSDAVKLFPNPAIDIVFINTPKAQTATLSNMQGQIQKVIKLKEGENKVNIESLNIGIYILKLENKEFKIIKKGSR